MAPLTQYHNTRVLANALLKEMKLRGIGQVSARPWNQFEPDNTLWWIIPSTEWPAYKFGKLFFSAELRHVSLGGYLCGIHIEKGIGPKYADLFPSKAGQRHIMGKDWAWYTLISDPSFKMLESITAQASRSLRTPVTIQIEAGGIQDPALFDPRVPRTQWDIISFETSGPTLKLKTYETPSNLLRIVKESRSPKNVAEFLATAPEAVWIDFFVGTVFERSYPENPNLWNASKLWKEALSIWLPYFK